MIKDLKANLTVGYFITSEGRDEHMKSSDTYYTSNLIWAIPPGEEYSSIEKLLMPFESTVWICFLIVLIVAFIVIKVLECCHQNIKNFVFGRNIKNVTLNVVNITLGGSLHKVPVRNFARTLFILFTFYCFIIQNVYRGGLFQFMRMTLRKPLISSTEELVNKDFLFYMYPTAYNVLKLDILKGRTRITDPKGLDRLLDKSTDPSFKGAMLTSEAHLANKNIEASPDNKYFYSTKDPIMTQNIAIYMHKESCFSDQINLILKGIINGGLFNKWVKQYTDTDALMHKASSPEGHRPINVDQLLGAFQLLGALLFISSAVFLIEIILRKMKKN
ncbi:CLUMA_CG011031, isoform A [Clunio marinus]|uniref:CLUMA_CG011031, isoform A n=1 Tax=Clunio marinus TaxID=568069 RepID=A0A1J1IF76_9DIPT|nr:CLUMA_CG011031, isoform A [Clunio marinus]